MISEIESKPNAGRKLVTLCGLSTDTKPTDYSIVNGSVFIEMDTKKVYFFDRAGNQWREFS